MARLPVPGADDGSWGGILNDYLSQAHNSDGTLKSISGSLLMNGSVSEAKLDSAAQAKLNTAGAVGATGASGPAGAAGSQGATGPAGPQGATGAQGPAGSQGNAGPAGATGAQGPAGTQGPAGATGATGPVGPAGADGTSVEIQGSVANAAALPTGLGSGDAGKGWITNDDGHLQVWTGSAWVDAGAIRGPAGPAGATGAAGAAGGAGATGPAGAAGPTGATGPQGPAGTGATGATGPVGATGPAGSGATWTVVTSTGGTVNANNGTWVIANPSASSLYVNLPAPVANGRVRVKRAADSGNSIIIQTPNGGVLDGGISSQATVNAGWMSADYESDGTNWYVV